MRAQGKGGVSGQGDAGGCGGDGVVEATSVCCRGVLASQGSAAPSPHLPPARSCRLFFAVPLAPPGWG